MSVSTASSRRNKDPIKVALALIGGGDPANIPASQVIPVVAALNALKREYMVIDPDNRKEDIDRCTELMAILNQRERPMRTPTKATRKNSGTPRKPKLPHSQRPPDAVAIRSLPDDEYDAIVDRIERSFMGEEDLSNGMDPLTKRKFLFVIGELKKQEAQEANYKGVQNLDLLASDITSPAKASLKPLKDEITAVKKRIDELNTEMADLEVERNRQLNEMTEQRHLELAQLMEQQDLAMDAFAQTLPQLDGDVRFTGELLRMRSDEVAYALGGDYEGARILHAKADIKEEQERHDALRRTLRTCNLKRDHFNKELEKQRQAFNTRWDGRMSDLNVIWEKVLACKQCQINKMTTKLDALKMRLRKLTWKRKGFEQDV